MKIVCQSCSATYKIADDKVQGKKVFKIKCKKCGEDILVRGADIQAPVEAPQRPVEEEATRAMSSVSESADAIWHAVINGDQQGPYAVDQLRELLAQGSMDSETYVWRDGFADWLPMHDVPELSSLLTAPPGPSATLFAPMESIAPPPAAEPEGDLFGSSTVAMQSPVLSPEGEDLFAQAPSAPVGAPTPMAFTATSAPVAAGLSNALVAAVTSASAKTRTSAKSLAGDLFAAEARAQDAARPLVPDAVPEPAETDYPGGNTGGATGTRNENSVLFSLATLQQLSGGPTNGSASAGAASGDSSGLIDINNLAGAVKSAPGGRKSAVDDILSVGTTGLGSPLSAPMLTPMALPPPAVAPMAIEPPRPEGINKTSLVTGVAVACILVVGGIGAAYVYSRRPVEAPNTGTNVAMNTPPRAMVPPGGPAAVAVVPTGAPMPAPAPTVPEVAAGTPGTTAQAGSPAAPGATAPVVAPATSHEHTHEHEHGSHGGGESPSVGAHGPAPTPTPPPAPTPSPRPARTGGGSVEDLMAQVAGGGGGHASAPRSAPSGGGGGGGDLPATPSRSDVIGAMHEVQPSVRSCGAGQGGMAMVTVVFAGSGRVTTATVGSPFGGTPVGTCVVRAVRSAHLPAFSNQTFNVTYPFPLQ